MESDKGDASPVLFQHDGNIAEIVLNRPEKRNAISPEMTAAIERAIDEIESNPAIHIGILAANGPVFCAGGDLHVVAAGGMAALRTERGGFGGLAQRERSKPLIAAVDGAALGGGLEIVLSCDLVIASSSALFGLPEVKRSHLAAAGGVTRLAKALPYRVAMELTLTGDSIAAEQAYHYGLVNHLCAPGEARAAARQLAARIAANGQLAVQAALRLIRKSRDLSDQDAFAEGRRELQQLAETEDFMEGARAFSKKRPPVWKGR